MLLECFFCGADLPNADPDELGENDRLAFDPRLGRLWQVCSECSRWNLTAIESRWEIVEQSERAAREARTLLRTEHLTLTSCGPGQLIRVGASPRSELAEWRYSSRLDAFGHRRGRFVQALWSIPELPVGGYDLYGAARAIPQSWVASPFIEHATLLSALFLNVPFTEQCPACAEPLFIHPAAFGDLRFERSQGAPVLTVPCGLCGTEVLIDIGEARPAVRAGLALVSRRYRQVSQIQRAVAPLDRMGGCHALLDRLCGQRVAIGELPKPARLALWVALDELAEAEALEAEWRTAETLARIADGELTTIPGFADFRQRVLAETPR